MLDTKQHTKPRKQQSISRHFAGGLSLPSLRHGSIKQLESDVHKSADAYAGLSRKAAPRTEMRNSDPRSETQSMKNQLQR